MAQTMEPWRRKIDLADTGLHNACVRWFCVSGPKDLGGSDGRVGVFEFREGKGTGSHGDLPFQHQGDDVATTEATRGVPGMCGCSYTGTGADAIGAASGSVADDSARANSWNSIWVFAGSMVRMTRSWSLVVGRVRSSRSGSDSRAEPRSFWNFL